MESAGFGQMIRDFWIKFLHFLPEFAAGLVVMLVFVVLAGLSERLVRRVIKRYADDPLIANFIGRVSQVIVVLIGVLLMFSVWGLGHISEKLLAGAGVLTIVLGLAMQDIGKNFFSGVVMAFSKPFKVGNVIESQGMVGVVTDMTLRQTHIKTFDGKDIYLPNDALINNPLQNYTIDGYMRYEFKIGLDYHSDPEQAIQIIQDGMHTYDEVVRSEGKMPMAFVSNLSPNAMEMTVHYWVFLPGTSVSALALKSDIIIRTLRDLKQAGMYIPTSIVEIKNYPLT
ncbi:MAG: mechanosensitive ion channel family protein [Saprospiraceae bacterium]